MPLLPRTSARYAACCTRFLPLRLSLLPEAVFPVLGASLISVVILESRFREQLWGAILRLWGVGLGSNLGSSFRQQFLGGKFSTFGKLLFGAPFDNNFGEQLCGAALWNNFVEQVWGAALKSSFSWQLEIIGLKNRSFGNHF